MGQFRLFIPDRFQNCATGSSVAVDTSFLLELMNLFLEILESGAEGVFDVRLHICLELLCFLDVRVARFLLQLEHRFYFLDGDFQTGVKSFFNLVKLSLE